VRFEVVTAITVKIPVFWDMTSCCLTETYRCFGGDTFHLRVKRVL